MSEAAESLNSALRSRKFVLVMGDCKVDYDGRASSTLDWGERVTIIKQDGSVLVHRPNGYEPVNWQPPKCLVRVALRAVVAHAPRLRFAHGPPHFFHASANAIQTQIWQNLRLPKLGHVQYHPGSRCVRRNFIPYSVSPAGHGWQRR